LAAVLDGICRLLHPVMPFVTEQVWQALGELAPVRGLPAPKPATESVCIAPWPGYPTDWQDADAERTVGLWQKIITAIRNLRAERNVPAAAKVTPWLVASEPIASWLREGEAFISGLTGASRLTIGLLSERPTESVVTVLPDVEVVLPLAGLIDKEAETARLRKKLAEIDKQLNSVRAKLRNEAFLSKASQPVVEQQRTKEAELEAQRVAVEALLAGG
jgi:valyl-tRNA synthetase